MRALVEAALEAVFPPRCVCCDVDLDAWLQVLCEACSDTVEPIREPICQRCGLPFEVELSGPRSCGACLSNPPAFELARASSRYGGALEAALQRFKFEGLRRLAMPLAALLCSPMPAGLAEREFDLVAPIPLGLGRLRERGYDQAWLLARELAKLLGVEARPRALRRLRETPPQSTLSAAARRSNVNGAFGPGALKVEGRRVLLVDDVITTGATIASAASVLRRAGAAEVCVLAVARAC